MKKFFGLALGTVLLSGVMSVWAVEIKYIDFSDGPETFVKIITDLASTRKSMLPGDREAKTKFIYGYLYEVAKLESQQEDVKKVQKELGVLAGQVINPKYAKTTQFIQSLLGPNSGAAIYSHLMTPNRINAWLSVIALYAYDETLIDPAEFIRVLGLNDKILDGLLSINPDAYKDTIFEVIARKALNKKNATAQEWLTFLKKQHEASVITFKDLAIGLDNVA